jgi:carbamoyltransferase
MNEEFTKHYKNVFVPPAIGDEGQAIGAYQHADFVLNENVHKSELYAGTEYNYVGKEKANYKEVAQAIADGKIVGWFQGRMEFGPRALGGRSILGDPRSPDMQKILNLKVKYRESFRPFAPSILNEDLKEWFEMNCDSPYMLMVSKLNSKKIFEMSNEQKKLFGIEKLNIKRSEIPAVTHVQFVFLQNNQHELLLEFQIF